MNSLLTDKKERRRYGIANNVNSLPKLTVTQEWLDEAHNEVFGSRDEWRAIPVTAFIDSSWSRLFDQYYRERIVHVRSNSTLLLRFAYDCEVDLDWVNSERDLLSLALHLCGKCWMTTERLHQFIETVASIKHFKVHGC